jgi:hypothetical protein
MTLLRMLYPNSGVSQIYLSKQSCTGHVVDDTVVFDQSYSNCSTSKTVYSFIYIFICLYILPLVCFHRILFTSASRYIYQWILIAL